MKLPSRMLPELLFQALLLKVVASTTHSVFGGKYRLRDLSSTFLSKTDLKGHVLAVEAEFSKSSCA
jgi:hypothetical protein